MTRTELKDFYHKKTELFNIQSTIEELYRYVAENPDAEKEIINNISNSLLVLRKDAADISKELLERTEEVNDTLHRIKDISAMIAATLHYREGNTWPAVAEILHSTEDAVKSSVYRAFRKYGI